MAEHDDETRTVMSLSVGARVGMTVALLMLVGAGYLLWSPIQLYPADGFPIMCGTATALPGDDLGTAACGEINAIRQWQAGSLALGAVLVALGSVYAFGVHRRSERLIGRERPSRSDRHDASTD